MNRTINSSNTKSEQQLLHQASQRSPRQSMLGTARGFCSTARQFFSKDNVDHPSIEENMRLKQQLEHLKQVKKSSVGVDESLVSQVNDDTLALKTQLLQYKSFVDQEKQKFLDL